MQAIATTRAGHDPTWLLWAIDIYRRTDGIPPLEVVDRVSEAASEHAGVVRGVLQSLLEQLGGSPRRSTPDELDALARLERMRRVLGEAVGGAGVGPLS